MDIIDILLAKKMTSQGQVDTYAAKAKTAATDAQNARSDAEAAVQTIEDAAATIAATQAEADDLLLAAQEALETAQEANIDTLSIEDVDDEIKKLEITRSKITSNPYQYYENLHVTYPDGTEYVIDNTLQLSKSTGTSETEGMTQKAITEALGTKADIATTATKEYVDNAIAAIPSNSGDNEGGVSNLGSENAGSIVIVDDNGNVSASDLTEAAIIEALIKSGSYDINNAIGIEIDYANKSIERRQEAIGKSMGQDFNNYIMYGGRVRCNVSDDGTITAFYGETNYRDDGTNGQVMIYQPKFYYQRTPMKTETTTYGKIMRREILTLSTIKQSGFKCHPLFMNGNIELDYVLLPAYEGSLSNSKLTSIAGTKPISNISIDDAEQYAVARGSGWHITNMAAESANQMLAMVEFGSLNGQLSLGAGISYINGTSNINCASITGSTSALGNTSGSANATINEDNGNTTTYTEAGKRAISYRGMENPWGNIWRFVGGLNIVRNNNATGGLPYICTDFNYTTNLIGNNYKNIGFHLPLTYGWISAMGCPNDDYDWVYMPAECGSEANSALPVGDNLYTSTTLNGILLATIGGAWSFQEKNGLFFYGCDHLSSESSQHSYGARLMFKPTKNNIYNANIEKWLQYMGG